jgi:hypothetical protein
MSFLTRAISWTAIAGAHCVLISSSAATQAIPVLRTVPVIGVPVKPPPRIDISKLAIDEIQVSEPKLDSALKASATTKKGPANLKELTGGFHVFQYQLSQDAAMKLNLIAVGGQLAGAEKVFVHDFMFYKDDTDENNLPIRWGAGVRLIIQAKSLAGSANFTSLPAIAASAEFRFAETSVDLRTIGMSGPKIVALVPKAAAYDVETHVAYMKTIDAIVAAGHDGTTVVTPEVVTVNPQDYGLSIDAIARAHAMRQMLLGKSCEDARKALAKNRSPRSEQSVNASYRELMGKCDNKSPSDAVRLAIVRDLFSKSGIAP